MPKSLHIIRGHAQELGYMQSECRLQGCILGYTAAALEGLLCIRAGGQLGSAEVGFEDEVAALQHLQGQHQRQLAGHGRNHVAIGCDLIYEQQG